MQTRAHRDEGILQLLRVEQSAVLVDEEELVPPVGGHVEPLQALLEALQVGDGGTLRPAFLLVLDFNPGLARTAVRRPLGLHRPPKYPHGRLLQPELHPLLGVVRRLDELLREVVGIHVAVRMAHQELGLVPPDLKGYRGGGLREQVGVDGILRRDLLAVLARQRQLPLQNDLAAHRVEDLQCAGPRRRGEVAGPLARNAAQARDLPLRHHGGVQVHIVRPPLLAGCHDVGEAPAVGVAQHLGWLGRLVPVAPG